MLDGVNLPTQEVMIYNLPKKVIKAIRGNSDLSYELLGYDIYDPHEGLLLKLVEIKGKPYFTMQWASVVKCGQQEESNDTPEESVEFEGDYLTRDEFDILIAGNLCACCEQEIEFVDGNKYIPGTDDLKCVVCHEYHQKFLGKAGNC